MTRRIVIPGGSGFLGSHLTRRLVDRGDEVTVLTRGPAGMRGGARHVRWDAATPGPWIRTLEGADAVVHLSGERVDVRPTRRNVDRLVRSRVETVRLVGEALRSVVDPPPVWVQVGTLAIHGDAGDRLLTDDTVPDGLGPRQMTTVALAWERAYLAVTDRVERRVLLRLGVTIGGGDPLVAQLGRLVRLGLGGRIASGRQWVSWIALEDVLQVFLRAIDDPGIRGTYAVSAPGAVTNAEMMATFRQVLRRPVGLPAPAGAVHLGARILGSDPALALTGRRGCPRRLIDEGFTFSVPTFEEAVRRALPST